MAEHTPGPWPRPTKSGDGKFISIEKWGPNRDNWHRLAVEIDSDDCDFDTAMANARLIAAAPDLLAACECEDAWDAYARGDVPKSTMVTTITRHGWDESEPPTEFIERIRRDAIARATKP